MPKASRVTATISSLTNFLFGMLEQMLIVLAEALRNPHRRGPFYHDFSCKLLDNLFQFFSSGDTYQVLRNFVDSRKARPALISNIRSLHPGTPENEFSHDQLILVGFLKLALQLYQSRPLKLFVLLGGIGSSNQPLFQHQQFRFLIVQQILRQDSSSAFSGLHRIFQQYFLHTYDSVPDSDILANSALWTPDGLALFAAHVPEEYIFCAILQRMLQRGKDAHNLVCIFLLKVAKTAAEGPGTYPVSSVLRAAFVAVLDSLAFNHDRPWQADSDRRDNTLLEALCMLLGMHNLCHADLIQLLSSSKDTAHFNGLHKRIAALTRFVNSKQQQLALLQQESFQLSMETQPNISKLLISAASDDGSSALQYIDHLEEGTWDAPCKLTSDEISSNIRRLVACVSVALNKQTQQ
jgi:hypothetical protein